MAPSPTDPRRLGVLAALVIAFASFPASAQTPPSEEDDVEIPAQPAPKAPPAPPAQSIAAPASPPPAASTSGAEIAALRKEMAETRARLEARIVDLERKKEAEKKENLVASASRPAAASQAGTQRSGWLDSLLGAGDYLLSAYVQAQYEDHQDSEDQLQQGGALLNQDRFLVRRGRLRFDAAFPCTELTLELDGNTARGPSFGLRRAEASLVLRARPWDGKVASREARDAEPPLAMLTFGLTEIPFGFELTDSNRNRLFMERTQASLAFFPGEPDVGLRLSGGLGFFRYALAIMNGEPQDDRSPYTLRDPNGAKDFVARVGVDVAPAPSLRVAGGVSALYGSGFHAGTPATKGAVQWRDLNENSAIDPGEVTALPGSAATPSASFERWAIGLDARARIASRLGVTSLFAEAGVAKNLDRGLFVADPIATGVDVRHLYYHAALVHEVPLWAGPDSALAPRGALRAIVGFRAEAYDPNADFLDNRTGKLLPTSQTIQTFSPLVGVSIPGRARLVFQYDTVIDALGRDSRGVPADLQNDRFTLRLQVEK